MFRFHEIKTGEKITDQQQKSSFDPDKRIERVETREIRIFDPDARGCYRTILVPVAETED